MQIKIIISLFLSLGSIFLSASEQDKKHVAIKNKTNSESILVFVTNNIDLQNIITGYCELFSNDSRTFKAQDQFRKISFSADGKYIIGILRTKEIIILDINTMKSECISDYKYVADVEISNNRKVFAVGYPNSEFKIIDTLKKSSKTYDLKNLISGLAFSNDDKHVAVFIDQTKKLHIFDISSGMINTVDMPAFLPDLRFSPDDKDLIAFSSNYPLGLTLINDIKTSKIPNSVIDNGMGVASAVYSSDGNHIAIGLNNNAIYICNKDGKFLKHISTLTLPSRVTSYMDLAFTNNKYIVSGYNNEIKFWDIDLPENNIKIDNMGAVLNKVIVSISPDYKYLISTDFNSPILKFWYNQRLMITETQDTNHSKKMDHNSCNVQ